MRKATLLIVLVVLLILLARQCTPFRTTPNEHVIDNVRERYKHAPWMAHVDDWDSALGISVTTDYPHDDLDSYAAAYDICRAVKGEYAKDATDLPNLRIYGISKETKIKVDGSKDKDTDHMLIASATSGHDYRCGIIPTEDSRTEAAEIGVPIYNR